MTVKSERYILNRSLDLWIVGLGSIFVISLLLILDPFNTKSANLAEVLTIATVINGAHFMASYRMLYHTKEYAMRYPEASIYMPLILVSYCIVAIWQAPANPEMVSGLLVVTSIYLALHYTGQTWGMMSSLAFIDQIKFTASERSHFRGSLKFLMAWQIFWSLTILDPKSNWLAALLDDLYFVPYILITGAAVLGSSGILSLYRNQKTLKLRVLVPYIALYFWYALLSLNPLALPLIQFFHAVQYLIFPLRVELNRHAGSSGQKTSRRHLAEYLATMLAVGAIAFVFVPGYLNSLSPTYAATVQLFIAAVNIHHFYIDGYIWKISQPLVKDELFAHLR